MLPCGPGVNKPSQLSAGVDRPFDT